MFAMRRYCLIRAVYQNAQTAALLATLAPPALRGRSQSHTLARFLQPQS